MAQHTSAFRKAVADVISTHLSDLDSTKPNPRLPLASPEGKERHESYLSYAQSKFAAAVYHSENVQRFLREDEAEAQQLASKLSDAFHSAPIPDATIHRVSATLTRSADRYMYELSAFLGALKSSLDMSAQAASFCVSGLNTSSSVTPLLRFAKKQPDHPVAKAVAKHANWITDLRSYRDQLVHRLILALDSGSASVGIDGPMATTMHPIILPVCTPRYVPDTRASHARAAMGPGGPTGISISEGSATIRRADGTQRVLFVDLSALPGPGYTTIEGFMDSQLGSFASYIAELLPALCKSASAL